MTITEQLDVMAKDAENGEISTIILGWSVRCYFNRAGRLVFFVDGMSLSRDFIPAFIESNAKAAGK